MTKLDETNHTLTETIPNAWPHLGSDDKRKTCLAACSVYKRKDKKLGDLGKQIYQKWKHLLEMMRSKYEYVEAAEYLYKCKDIQIY